MTWVTRNDSHWGWSSLRFSCVECHIRGGQKRFTGCSDRDWFILLGFSRVIGRFKPAEIQEEAEAGVFYTLVSALITKWFDKGNISMAFFPQAYKYSFNVCLFLTGMRIMVIYMVFLPPKPSEWLSRWHPFYSFVLHQVPKISWSWSLCVCETSSVKM